MRVLVGSAGRLGALALTLGVVFAMAFGVGRLTGSDKANRARGKTRAALTTGSMAPVGGTIFDGGYTLSPKVTRLHDHGDPVFEFTITGPDGTAVTRFASVHGTQMDLVVVGSDLSGYRHVQPRRAADGGWSVPLRLAAPGSYRAFVTFQPAGTGRVFTLGTNVVAGGDYQPEDLPAPSQAVEVGETEVGVAGWLRPRRWSRLVFSVAHDGEPVRDLQPYFGGYARLVAVRGGDLAYLPVRARADNSGPDLAFDVAVPGGPGRYRLFLDFMRGGEMRTVAFTMIAEG